MKTNTSVIIQRTTALPATRRRQSHAPDNQMVVLTRTEIFGHITEAFLSSLQSVGNSIRTQVLSKTKAIHITSRTSCDESDDESGTSRRKTVTHQDNKHRGLTPTDPTCTSWTYYTRKRTTHTRFNTKSSLEACERCWKPENMHTARGIEMSPPVAESPAVNPIHRNTAGERVIYLSGCRYLQTCSNIDHLLPSSPTPNIAE